MIKELKQITARNLMDELDDDYRDASIMIEIEGMQGLMGPMEVSGLKAKETNERHVIFTISRKVHMECIVHNMLNAGSTDEASEETIQ